MSDPESLGKHEIDMSVYAKAAAHETLLQEGVVRMNSGFSDKLGMNRVPGVSTRIEEDGALHIDISVIVRYGTDLRQLGPAIQEAVLNGIRCMSDQPVGQVNVFIADIEFPKEAPEAPPEDEGP